MVTQRRCHEQRNPLSEHLATEEDLEEELRSVPPGHEKMDYSLNNGFLYPLRIVLLPVKWNNLHFAPNPITGSKSVPNIRAEREFKRSRPQVKRSPSEGHLSTVSLEEVLLSLKEWKQNKVCRRVSV